MQPRKNIKLFQAASIIAWIAAATVLSPAVSRGQVAGMTLDQAQEIGNYHYDDYRSGWQSFTAGTNGHLGAVDLQLYSTAGSNWTATLAIYEGQGTTGTRLSSQTIAGNGVLKWNTYVLEMPVRQTSGSVYTVSFANASTGLSVRLGLQAYDGGRCSQHGSYD